MVGIHSSLNPLLIQEYNEDFELVVVEFSVNHQNIRVMSGCGPQESWPEEERLPFFMSLEQEVIKAKMEGKSIIIAMDANSKLGPDVIPGDKHSQSPNGRILADIILRHQLFVANGSDKCRRRIKRVKVTTEGLKKAQ